MDYDIFHEFLDNCEVCEVLEDHSVVYKYSEIIAGLSFAVWEDDNSGLSLGIVGKLDDRNYFGIKAFLPIVDDYVRFNAMISTGGMIDSTKLSWPVYFNADCALLTMYDVRVAEPFRESSVVESLSVATSNVTFLVKDWFPSNGND